LGAVVLGLVAVFLRLDRGKGVGKAKTSSSGHDVGRFFLKLDLGGSLLLIASMCCLFMAIQWGGHRLPWSSPIIIGLFSVSGVLLVLFLLAEWKMGDDASVPFGVMSDVMVRRSGRETTIFIESSRLKDHITRVIITFRRIYEAPHGGTCIGHIGSVEVISRRLPSTLVFVWKGS